MFERRDVRYWHLADIDAEREHVRSWGLSGHPLIGALVSANDPKQTLKRAASAPSREQDPPACRASSLWHRGSCAPSTGPRTKRQRDPEAPLTLSEFRALAWRLGTTKHERWVGSPRMITEVEAYTGSQDLAFHRAEGLTKRNEAMFGPPGNFLCFVHGMHWMVNVVTGPVDYPAAVLIRSVETTRIRMVPSSPEEARKVRAASMHSKF